jgi:hypothetical protein
MHRPILNMEDHTFIHTGRQWHGEKRDGINEKKRCWAGDEHRRGTEECFILVLRESNLARQ